MKEDVKQRVKSQIIGLVVVIPLISVLVYVLCFAPRKSEPVDSIVEREEHSERSIVEGDTTVLNVNYSMFDPNEDDLLSLLEAGLPRNVAVGIIRWRESGKVYRIKEDLFELYDMSDSLYFAIEDYIYIGEEYRYKTKTESAVAEPSKEYEKREKHQMTQELRPFSLDTISLDYLRGVGFSYREAELVIRYRDMIGGYRCFEEFEECYGVDSIMAERLKPYLIFPEKVEPRTTSEIYPIELNSADSTTLRKVVGIGEKSVMHIIRYRELLGGYYSPTQISELEVVTTENFRKILPQIWCDSAKIKKININFASPNELKTHPYLSSRMLKRLIKQRELKGGWSTIEEMIEDKIFTEDEAARIAPYLSFGTQTD